MEPMHSSSDFNKPQQNVPNSNGAFVLGILSLVATTVLCICHGYIIGIILGVIGLVLGVGAKKRYALNPEDYTEQSFRKAKTGVILNLIGLIISVIGAACIIAFLVAGFNGNLPPQFQEGFDNAMNGNR